MIDTRIDPIVEKWKVNYKENLIKKLFSSEKAKTIKFLTNNQFYHKVPIVLVAAGPSLDKNIRLLKDYQNNCLIIGADVILYKLVENDIHPDFVCNIDPSDDFHRFWKGIDTSKYSLVCPTICSPITIEFWKGNVFFFNPIDPAEQKQKVLSNITKLTSRFGSLENNYFVGATMFLFSKLFFPSQVIFVGYDFGFTEERAYCEGFLERKLYDLNNVGMNILRKNELNYELCVDVDDSFVKTTHLLDLYKQTLLRLIFSNKIKCINSTEGGTLIEIIRMPLKDSLQEYCSKSIIKYDTTILKGRR